MLLTAAAACKNLCQKILKLENIASVAVCSTRQDAALVPRGEEEEELQNSVANQIFVFNVQKKGP